jgi:hypothetical protein
MDDHGKVHEKIWAQNHSLIKSFKDSWFKPWSARKNFINFVGLGRFLPRNFVKKCVREHTTS